MELAKGRVDVLEAASWALEAQHLQGYRDPKEVAGEQFKNVDTSARNVDSPFWGQNCFRPIKTSLTPGLRRSCPTSGLAIPPLRSFF